MLYVFPSRDPDANQELTDEGHDGSRAISSIDAAGVGKFLNGFPSDDGDGHAKRTLIGTKYKRGTLSIHVCLIVKEI